MKPSATHPARMTGLTGDLATLVSAQKRRRRISPQAGRALEILGHAIDYLLDEYLRVPGMIDRRDGELQAVELLMAKNREIYFACPIVPSLREQLRSLFRS
jgi:hypothetical protein